MDSRLIYAAANALEYKITWNRVTPESEWLYIGTEDSLNKAIVIEWVNRQFTDGILNIVLHRDNSFQVTKQNFIKTINDLSDVPGFAIWDEKFKRTIAFNKIGTMRFGQVNTITIIPNEK